MIERFNQMAAQMLATFVKGNKRDWDEHLPYLMLAYRSTIHESTQCSPNQMVYGRDLALPVDVIAGTPPIVAVPTCPVVYVEWLRDALERSFGHAREALQKAVTRQKRLYDRKAKEHGFSVGEWVLSWYPPAAHTKFGSGWTGPYLVVEKLSDLVYKVQASKRSKFKIVHLDHLKPYYVDEDEQLVNWLDGSLDAKTPEKPIGEPDAGINGPPTLVERGSVAGELVSDGYTADHCGHDSDHGYQKRHGSSGIASGVGQIPESGTTGPLRRSKRAIRHPKRFLLRVNHSSMFRDRAYSLGESD